MPRAANVGGQAVRKRDALSQHVAVTAVTGVDSRADHIERGGLAVGAGGGLLTQVIRRCPGGGRRVVTVGALLDLPAPDHEVVLVGRVGEDGTPEHRAGEGGIDPRPVPAAVFGDADHAGCVLLDDPGAVVWIDPGVEAIAAEDRNRTPGARLDHHLAVVLEAGHDGAVFRDGRVIGLERVQPYVGALGPAVVVEVLARQDMLLVDAAVVADQQRDTAGAVRHQQRSVLVGRRGGGGIRWRYAVARVPRGGGHAAEAGVPVSPDHLPVTGPHNRPGKSVFPDLLEAEEHTRGKPRRDLGRGWIDVDPEVVPGLDAR